MSGYANDLRQMLARGERRPEKLLEVLLRIVNQLDDRIDPLEKRLLIVDELPAQAPFGALIRVRGDQTGALYTGNGPGRPLGKLTPVAV